MIVSNDGPAIRRLEIHVIAQSTLTAFCELYPDATVDLMFWHREAERNRWATFAEVRQSYPDADRVGKLTVFNICHNKYRLIVDIHHNRNRAYIAAILTHKDYDRDLWKRD